MWTIYVHENLQPTPRLYEPSDKKRVDEAIKNDAAIVDEGIS
jgi:hypothetical protein